MKTSHLSAIALFVCIFFGEMIAFAQVPSPGKPQEGPIVLLGATVHVGNGQVIENAALAFENGKITEVSPQADFKGDLARYKAVQLDGKHIYPGFILPNTDLGLVEIGAVRATVDSEEIGQLNPNIRAIISYNTDSELIPASRFNGILLAQTTPHGGLVSGASSVVQLDAWNWEDAAVKIDDALHLNWPGRYRNQFDFETFTVSRVKNKNYATTLQALEQTFADAIAHKSLGKQAPINLKLSAMHGLFDGTKALHLHVDEAREIVESIQFAQKHGVKNIVLVGASDALSVVDFLKEHKIPVVVADVHRLPSRRHEDYNLPYRLPAELHKAGITVALAYEGVSNARNLAFYAGTTATHGSLTPAEALQLITQNTAKILGIDHTYGTLEKGKSATLFVSTGDALDMLGNKLEHAFIDGRELTLPAMQQRLYEKYKAKYGLE